MIKRLTLTFILAGMCLLTMPSTAHAFDFFGSTCGNGSTASSSAVCNTNTTDNPISGTKGLVLKITNIIAYIAGAAAVIVIMVGALQFVTSGSDTSKGGRVDDDVANARRTIASAVVGIAVILLARTIIIYVVKRI